MNTKRAQEAAGRRIEVHFADERELIVVDLADGTDADDVAAALVGCMRAPSVDDAEGHLQVGLGELGGTVTRAP